MKSKFGFVQGYNAQVAVSCDPGGIGDQIVLGVVTTQTGTDHHLGPVIVAAAAKNLERIVAEVLSPENRERLRLATVLADAGYANEETFAKIHALKLKLLAPLASDQKVQQGEPADAGADLSKRPATRVGQERLATEDGAALYRLRGCTVEPVFGQWKVHQELRQLRRRGLANAEAEVMFVALVHNVGKVIRVLRRAGQSVGQALVEGVNLPLARVA